MKTFENFFKDEYIALENVIKMDQMIYPKIIAESANLYTEDVKQLEQDLKNKDKAKEFLTNEEEDNLMRIIKADPFSEEADKARAELIEHNMKLIKKMAIKAINAGVVPPEKKEEAIDASYDGFIRAMDTWIEAKNNHFKPWALTQMGFAIRNNLDPDRKHSVDQRTHENSIVSIDSPIEAGGYGKGDNNSEAHTIGDKIQDNSVIPGNDDREIYMILNSFLDSLPEKEAKIVKLYHFGDGVKKDKDGKNAGLTYDEIGKKLNISKVGVRNILQRVYANLRKSLEDNGIDSQAALAAS